LTTRLPYLQQARRISGLAPADKVQVIASVVLTSNRRHAIDFSPGQIGLISAAPPRKERRYPPVG
jgi:hypothetical protein